MTAVIAMLLVLSTLSGCASAAAEPVPAEDALEALSATGTAAACRVELEVREDAALDEDGTELALIRYEAPVMTALGEDGRPVPEGAAAEAAEAFNAQFAAWLPEEGLRELAERAREDRRMRRATGDSRFYPYTEYRDCQVYQTDSLVSVSAVYSSYTGGAHPNYALAAWTFDLSAGEFVTPEALAKDGEAFGRAVGREIVRQIRNGETPESEYWEDYEDIAAGWSSCAVSFGAEGMTVGFSPYEIACYAAGSPEFLVSYQWLEPYLNDRGLCLLGLEKPESFHTH